MADEQNQGSSNGVTRYRVDRLEADINEIKRTLNDIQRDQVDIKSSVASLNAKSGAWGAIGALLMILLALLAKFLFSA